jgi:hypothetical protein
VLLAAALPACTDFPTPVDGDDRAPITVAGSQPTAAGTSESIDVRVFGSGFRQGDVVAGDLGLPEGFVRGIPEAVNVHGWIVGTAFNAAPWDGVALL